MEIFYCVLSPLVEQSLSMDMQTYLKQTGHSINSWAAKNSIPATTVWRAVKRKVLRPSNALLIERATDGAVTIKELLYPQ
jgi:hypothetical protein